MSIQEVVEVETWYPERGFGFLKDPNDDGSARVFVHASSITPRPERGADLAGVSLTNVKLVKGERGWKVQSADLFYADYHPDYNELSQYGPGDRLRITVKHNATQVELYYLLGMFGTLFEIADIRMAELWAVARSERWESVPRHFDVKLLPAWNEDNNIKGWFCKRMYSALESIERLD